MTAPRSIDNSIGAARQKDRADALAVRAMAAQGHRAELAWILDSERRDRWHDGAYRNFAQWVGAHLSVSEWTARRMIDAARALPSLPLTDAAFQRGELRLEHVLELCRFVTPKNEAKWVRWARRVKPKVVRHKADVETRKSRAEAIDVDRSRYLHHWWMDDGRLGLEGAFPPDQGAVIAKALDRMADRVPDIVDEDDLPTPPDVSLEIRRADALFALASTRIANDQDADRATVVVHAELKTLADGRSGCEIEDGPAIHVDTARRLSCDGTIEVVLHNELGQIVGIGRRERKVPRWLRRSLKYRDGRCTFPGCDAKYFLHAHHIRHWTRGGPTDLDNLTLVCTFHHKLLHEYGWRVEFDEAGVTRWFRPGGTIYEPGRAPPAQQELEVA